MGITSRFDIKKIVTLAIFVLIGIFVILKGAIYYPDSYAFLEMRFNRSPLYASFLKLFTAIFGAGFEYPLIVVQYLIILTAARHLIRTITLQFKVALWGQLVMLLVLLAPCIHWHYVANKILSEALAYPLLLLVISEAIHIFLNSNMKRYYRLALWLFLLLLTRGQFIAVVPILVLFQILNAWRFKHKQLGIRYLLILLCVPIATYFVERSFNKVVHGHFVNNAMNYVHLISADFYLSNQKDADLFDDPDQKTFFEEVHGSLEAANLLQIQNMDSNLDDQQQFQYNFTKICNRRVHEIGLQHFKEKELDNVEQHVAIDDLCASMVYPMMNQHMNERISLIYKNLKTTYGSSKYLVLFVLLLAFGIYGMFYFKDKFYEFMVLILTIMFVNNLAVSIVVHPINRYTFYFDWILFAILIILLDRYSKKVTQ